MAGVVLIEEEDIIEALRIDAEFAGAEFQKFQNGLIRLRGTFNPARIKQELERTLAKRKKAID